MHVQSSPFSALTLYTAFAQCTCECTDKGHYMCRARYVPLACNGSALCTVVTYCVVQIARLMHFVGTYSAVRAPCASGAQSCAEKLLLPAILAHCIALLAQKHFGLGTLLCLKTAQCSSFKAQQWAKPVNFHTRSDKCREGRRPSHLLSRIQVDCVRVLASQL